RRRDCGGTRLSHGFGSSVGVAVLADILKIHVHTDTPEAVFTYAARWGRVETTKADDMRAQHRRLAHPDRRPVSVVNDSSADLTDGVLERHHIALVPLQVVFGDESLRDRFELPPDEFYRRPRVGPHLPTTSQPTPAEFTRVLRDARSGADEVVGVFLSSRLSGTYGSAQTAVMPRVLALLEQRLTPRPTVVRFGVVHTQAAAAAERVRAALEAAYRPRDCFVTLATGVLGAHVGEGAWAIFYQVEDGTPARLDPAAAGTEESNEMQARNDR
ncbi:MAG: DegV family protein, partial [Gemmatimonadales bacterium]